MVAENPTCGAPRIHGELLKLGFDLSVRSVSRWMRRAPRDADPVKQLLAFLRNHREAIAAMDFFTVPTLTFGVLYCFFVIVHDRRKILHFNVTRNPHALWIVQQLREAWAYQQPHRFLLFDRDAKFGADVVSAVKEMGSEPTRTAFRSPWQNGVAWLDDALSKYSDEFQRTLNGFHLDKVEGETGPWSCPARSTDKLLTRLKKESAEAVLAIVPDPVHTHLSLFFDRQIDAIRQAAQDKGYYFDRAIMPWDSKDHPESADVYLRLQQERYHRCTEKHPGLMIFRAPRDGARDQQNTKQQQSNHKVSRKADEDSVERDLHHGAVLVLVVGETPTSGIRKDQFQEAVADISTLLGSAPPRGRLPTLRILGPTFSGSLYSFQGLIESNRDRFSEFRVYNGAVNSYESTEQFRQFLGSPKYLGTFAIFQESAELQKLLFVRFLLGRGYTAAQFAMLSEDQTAYGPYVDSMICSLTRSIPFDTGGLNGATQSRT
jgi:hypothetical protein